MTQRCWADETVPPPRPVWWAFTCDGDHGLFPPPDLVVEVSPPKPCGWSQAVRAGWVITPERDHCPECKRTAPRVAHDDD